MLQIAVMQADASELFAVAGGRDAFRFELRTGSRGARGRRVLPVLGAAMLGAAIAMWFLPDAKDDDRTAADGEIRSLAVLPLDNLSGDPGQEFFSDTMTGELIAAIAQIRGLRVISKPSAMRFKGERPTLREIGAQLDADVILEGSAQRQAGQVRIAVQLIDARTDAHLWAGNFTRPHENVFRLQDDVAAAVANAIAREIADAAATRDRPRVVPRAHELYWRGRALLDQGNVAAALHRFQQAIELDPEFAPGYAGIASAYDWMIVETAISPREGIRALRSATRRALALDPLSAEAVANRANLDQFEWRWDEAEEGYRRAIELDPSFTPAYLFLGAVLSLRGRCEEALAITREGHRRDPLGTRSNVNYSQRLVDCGKSQEAIQVLNRFLARDAGDPLARALLALLLVHEGQIERGIEESLQLAQQYPKVPAPQANLAWAYAVAGQPERSREQLARALELAENGYLPASLVARTYSALRARDETFQWLERAYLQRDYYLNGLVLSGDYRWLEDDPSFRALVKRLGLGIREAGG